jgi:predicted RNase H-like HicB family nuclease
MLSRYLDAAMHQAQYEILSDDQSFYGEIPGLDGVYANAPTLEQCREQLREVLEEWIVLRISRQLAVPPIGEVRLQVTTVACCRGLVPFTGRI